MNAYALEFGGLKYFVRAGTSDWNTVNACAVEDEYGLADVLHEDVLVFDLGAHVGGVAIWAASRGCQVVAVEPVPENAELIRESIRANNLTLNAEVVEAAVGLPPKLLLRYNWHGDENAAVHSFIGNTGLGNEGYPANTEVWVPTVTFSALVRDYGLPDVVKTDCEGGEWQIFDDPFIHLVPLISGEWHDLAKGYLEEDGVWHETQPGYRREQVAEKLHRHDVSFSGPEDGAGGFRAVLR